MKLPPATAVPLSPNARSIANLRGQRWAVVMIRRAVWLVSATPDGPRGVRLACDGGRPVAYDVGGFVLLLAAKGPGAFAIPEEDINSHDNELFKEWSAAGRPQTAPPNERGDR